jgi:hypothetical protein
MNNHEPHKHHELLRPYFPLFVMVRDGSWSKFFILLLILTLFSLPLFAHNADIEIEGENRYKSLRLIPQVYNASHNKLFDLLIKDRSGETVPYFINTSLQEKNTSRETWLMVLIDSYTKDDSFFFDYKLAEERNSDTVATSIEFATWNSGFAKSVDVSGSHDGINWDFVQSDTLYSVDDKAKLAINFNRPQKFTYYRIRLGNNLERILFYRVNLVYSTVMSEETWFIESLAPPFTVESENKRTKIIIEGLKHLRLCDMVIETDSMFIRNFTTPGGVKKELYHLSINGALYNDTTLPLGRTVSRDDTYIVTVNDGDDRPINVKGITVRYYADDLVFEGNAGETYTLEFGADSVKSAPVYDISRYKNEILKGPVDRLSLGEIRYIEPAPEKVVFNKIIFNIAVILVALLLGVLIVLRLKR